MVNTPPTTPPHTPSPPSTPTEVQLQPQLIPLLALQLNHNQQQQPQQQQHFPIQETILSPSFFPVTQNFIQNFIAQNSASTSFSSNSRNSLKRKVEEMFEPSGKRLSIVDESQEIRVKRHKKSLKEKDKRRKVAQLCKEVNEVMAELTKTQLCPSRHRVDILKCLVHVLNSHLGLSISSKAQRLLQEEQHEQEEVEGEKRGSEELSFFERKSRKEKERRELIKELVSVLGEMIGEGKHADILVVLEKALSLLKP